MNQKNIEMKYLLFSQVSDLMINPFNLMSWLKALEVSLSRNPRSAHKLNFAAYRVHVNYDSITIHIHP